MSDTVELSSDESARNAIRVAMKRNLGVTIIEAATALTGYAGSGAPALAAMAFEGIDASLYAGVNKASRLHNSDNEQHKARANRIRYGARVLISMGAVATSLFGLNEIMDGDNDEVTPVAVALAGASTGVNLLSNRRIRNFAEPHSPEMDAAEHALGDARAAGIMTGALIVSMATHSSEIAGAAGVIGSGIVFAHNNPWFTTNHIGNHHHSNTDNSEI